MKNTKGSMAMVAGLVCLAVLVGPVGRRAEAQTGCPAAVGLEEFGPLNQSPVAVVVSGGHAYAADAVGMTVYDIGDPTSPSWAGELPLPGGGTAIGIIGAYMVVGAGDSALEIVDVSDPSSPVVSGTFSTRDPIQDLAVEGNVVYLAEGTGGVEIVDVSDPAAPRLLGGTLEYTNAVTVNGTIVFAARGYPGLDILDVSDPSNPVLLSNFASSARVDAVAVSNGTAFLSEWDSRSGYILETVDVSDPSSPVPLGTSNHGGADLEVVGDRVYLAAGDMGLEILDVSDPSAPVFLGRGPTRGATTGVAVDGSHAFAADSSFGLVVFDVTDASQFPLLGQYDTPAWALAIVSSGSRAYVADSTQGLEIFDVSSPGTMTLLGTFTTTGSAMSLAVHGNLAYVGESNQMLEIVDITDPAAPVLLGSFSSAGYIAAVSVTGTVAYLAEDDAGMEIVDVSDPTAPALLGTFTAQDWIRHVTVVGNVAYVGTKDLLLVDVSNPTAPVLLSRVMLGEGAVRGVSVPGSTAYVAHDGQGLVTVDVSNPSSPAVLSLGAVRCRAQDVVLSGSVAYLGDKSLGVHAVDVSNPSSPVLLGVRESSGRVRSLAVTGGVAYLAEGDAGLETVDLTQPHGPAPLGAVNTGGEAHDMAVSGSVGYVADGWAGLRILDLADPGAPVPLGTVSAWGEAEEVVLSSTMAYVKLGNGMGIQAIDVSDPAAPVVRGTTWADDWAPIAVSGNVLIVRRGYLTLLDVSNPAQPAELWHDTNSWEILSLAAEGNMVYVGVRQYLVAPGSPVYNGLLILDISDPTAPVIHGPFELTDGAEDVAVAGNLACLATGTGGLKIMDVSDPDAPVMLSTLDLPGPVYGVSIAWPEVLASTRSSQGDGLGAFHMVDVSDPSAPQLEATFTADRPFNGEALDAATKAVWLTESRGLEAVDVRCMFCKNVQAAANPAEILTGGETSQITVQIVDPFGDPLPGRSVEGTTSLGSLSAFTDNGDGSYGATLTSSATAGEAVVHLVVEGQPCAATAQVNIVCAAGTVDPPGNVRITGHGDRQLTLAWDGSPGAVGYRIYRGGFRVGETVAGATTFVDTGLSPAETYCYRVAAVDTCSGETSAPEVCTTTTGQGERCASLAGSDVLGFSSDPGMRKSAVRNGVAYVADRFGLGIIDVSDPAHPRLLSHWRAPEAATGVALLRSRDQVLLADGDSGLFRLDVVDPAHPHRIGHVTVPGHVEDVSAASFYGLLAVGSSGVALTQIGNPWDLSGLHWVDTPGYAWAVETWPTGETKALVADGFGGLEEISWGESGTAQVVWAFPNTAAPPRDVTISGHGGYAFLAEGNTGVQVFHLSDFWGPTPLSTHNTPGFATGVAFSNATIHVADDWADLQEVDVHEPVHPRLLGGTSSPGHTLGVSVAGDVAFLSRDNDGFQTVDVSDPAAPVILGSTPPGGSARAVAVSGNLAVVADGTLGLRIEDVSDPARPVAVGKLSMAGDAAGVAVNGTTVYVADGGSGLRIAGIADPTAPTLLGTFATSGQAVGVTVAGDLAYVVEGEAGMEIVDVTDPSSPVLVAGVDTGGAAQGVVVTGDLAYVADGDGGLVIVDVAEPSAPVLRGVLGTSGPARHVAVTGALAYLAEGEAGLEVAGVSDPDNPVSMGVLETPGEAWSVRVSGTLAYVADGSGGLAVVDAADPAAPSLVDTVGTRGESMGIDLSNGRAYVADGSSLEIFTLQCRAPVAEFRVDRLTGYLAFEDQSLYGPDSWSWDFGDGQTSSERFAGQYFFTPGRYTVTLTAANSFGSSQVSHDVAVQAFEDVPPSFWAFDWINTLYKAYVTSGCDRSVPLHERYCPFDPTTRAQMAKFLLKSKWGGGYRPPRCTTPPFDDVPCGEWFSDWVSELKAEGITKGCHGGSTEYCPFDPVTRAQMAVFLLRTLEGPDYQPPQCTTPPFDDVPCGKWYSDWVAELKERGITTGCHGNDYCPFDPVTRAQMAAFLDRAFGLGN